MVSRAARRLESSGAGMLLVGSFGWEVVVDESLALGVFGSFLG